jgi:hypothetical protein
MAESSHNDSTIIPAGPVAGQVTTAAGPGKQSTFLFFETTQIDIFQRLLLMVHKLRPVCVNTYRVKPLFYPVTTSFAYGGLKHPFSLLGVVRTHIGDIIAYQHGLHFCQEVYPYRNQNKV